MSATLRSGGSLLIGILLFLPLPGEDDSSEPSADEVKVEELLGRAELFDPASEKIQVAREAVPVTLIPPVASTEEPPLTEEPAVAAAPAPPAPLIQSAGEGPGKIEGVIFDREGAGIPRALLTFPDLGGLQLRSDRQGKFSLTGLPAGPLAVEILKPSYLTRLEVIQVLGQGLTKVSFSMELKPIELADERYVLEEREVLVDYEEENFGGIVLGGGESASFVSGIGKEDFARQSVSNAGEAVGRVSGANIVDGKYAVVRGLADRYVTTSFNNGSITSADPSRKTVQLDLFPTSVLEGISVAKTYDASMPGDFGGGAINIQTLSMPDERFVKVGYRIGWNSNLGGTFYRNPNRDLGFWGDVDEPFDRSKIFDENGSFLGGSGNRSPDPEANAAWDSLIKSTGFVGRASKPRPSQKFNLTYGDRFDLNDDVRLGVIASFSHSTEDKMQLGRIRSRPGIERYWSQDDYTSEVDWGLFLSGQLEIGDDHTLRATYFKKRIAEDRYTFATDVDFDQAGIRWGVRGTSEVRNGIGSIPGFGADAYYLGEYWQGDTTIRDLSLFQLSGQHKFREGALELGWGITSNQSSEARPNSSVLRYGVLDFTDDRIAEAALNALGPAAADLNTTFGLGFDSPTWDQVTTELIARGTFGASTASILEGIAASALANAPVYDPSLGRVTTFANTEYTGDSPGALFSEILNQRIEEDTTEYFADAAYSFFVTDDIEARIKGGFRSSTKKRSSRGQRYLIDVNTLAEDQLYGPDSLGVDATDDPDLLTGGTDGSENGITLEDGNALEVRNFDGNSSLLGLYLSGEVEWDTYLLGLGLRHEKETRGYQTLPEPFNLSTAANKSGEVSNSVNIPSIYLTRSFDDDRFRVGAYFSRTVARPTFFEFLPAKTIEQDTGFERRGDFGLKDTTITNLDLTFEWDVTDDSRISIAPFYKHLDDPIISVVRRSQSFIGFQNALEGNLKGFELEFDIGEFKPFTFRGNYTFIDSELLAEINTGGAGFQPVSLRYPNQPSNIFNFSVGYENEEHGWSSNLIYNFTGENALFLKISEDDADVVSPAFHSLDFNLQKRFEFTNMDMVLGVTVKNVLDSKAKVQFDGGGTAFEDEVFDIKDSGRSIWLEGKIEF